MIFLSHSFEDQSSLFDLVAALESLGMDVWFAPKRIRPGASFTRKMSQGLKKSERLLVAWSGNAERSVHVATELHAFYATNPLPDLILFMQLDETPPPSLFADRIHFRSTGNAAHDASVIANWASGQHNQQFRQQGAESSGTHFLRQCPRGPMVELHWITDDLILAYAKSFHEHGTATMVLMKAKRLRLDADPGDPHVTTVGPEALPSLHHVGAYVFWQAAFHEACKHGPRMLAALLLAHPDDLFTRAAQKDRSKLLRHLRTMNSPDE